MSITFYATITADHERPYMPNVPVLLPASSWWNLKFRKERAAAKRGRPRTYAVTSPRLPAHITDRAADSGGFVAMTKWRGEYPYTPSEYVAWLETAAPLQWAATMDFCCEPEIATDADAIATRQERTTDMARFFFEEYRVVPWVWVPTIQGWHVDDYRAHARQMAPLIEEMQEHYGPDSAFRVGIGTLCQRADTRMIREVVKVVAKPLPDSRFHLWGVKLDALKDKEVLPYQIISTDSGAWNGQFYTGIERWRATGLTRKRYEYGVALPEYIDRFDRALSTPRQHIMEFE